MKIKETAKSTWEQTGVKQTKVFKFFFWSTVISVFAAFIVPWVVGVGAMLSYFLR